MTDVERGARNVSLSMLCRLYSALETLLSTLLLDVDCALGRGYESLGLQFAIVPSILLVDDNPIEVEIALRVLKRSRLGNRIHTVCDGNQALEYLFGLPAGDGSKSTPAAHSLPAMVLLDIHLPGLFGLEVLRQIREVERTRTLPVIIMVGSANP